MEFLARDMEMGLGLDTFKKGLDILMEENSITVTRHDGWMYLPDFRSSLSPNARCKGVATG